MGQRSGAWVPAVVCLVSALLACKQSPEEKRKAAAEDARLKAKVADYVVKLAAVNTAVESVDKASLADKPCDGLKTATPKGTALMLRSVYQPWMKRFGGAKTDWKKNEGDWAFLTDDTFAGRFEKHPDDMDSSDLRSVGTYVEDYFEPERFLVVVMPEDESKNALPVWHEEGPFDSGIFHGWMFVVDVISASIQCQKKLSIENSEEIQYRTGGRRLGALRNQDPKEVLEDDFEDNFEGALKKGVEPGGLVTTMGRLLK